MLDDWLTEPLPQSHAREYLDLLDDRFRKVSCIIISQLPDQDWHSKIQAPNIADAILDSIVHDVIRIELRGDSMRKMTSTLKHDPLYSKGGNVAPLCPLI